MNANENRVYEHAQSGAWMGIPVLVMGVIPLLLGFWLPHAHALWGLWILPILVILAWLFRRFTIQVGAQDLSWWFGGGWYRKSVRRADIGSIRRVRTSWMEGWGIHFSRYGVLYNIRGFDAVEVTLKSGAKFCLGTDEPEVLMAYLQGMDSPR